MNKKTNFPPGWDESRVKRVLELYESQSEYEALAEDAAAYEDSNQTFMEIPNESDEQSNFLLYTGNDGKVNVEVFVKDETVWLTQKAMAELFGVKIPAISKYLSNIFKAGDYFRIRLFPSWK